MDHKILNRGYQRALEEIEGILKNMFEQDVVEKLDDIIARLERLEKRQVSGLERIEERQVKGLEEIKENAPPPVGSFASTYQKKE